MKAKHKGPLKTFTDLGCHRDLEVEKLFKVAFADVSGYGFVTGKFNVELSLPKLTNVSVTNSFNLSSSDGLFTAVKFVTGSKSKLSFIVYNIRPISSLNVEYTYVTFFKSSSALEYIELLNNAMKLCIVENVLNS